MSIYIQLFFAVTAARREARRKAVAGKSADANRSSYQLGALRTY